MVFGDKLLSKFIIGLWIVACVLVITQVDDSHHDIVKQWGATKCILGHTNPYGVTLDMLNSALCPQKAKETNLWDIEPYVRQHRAEVSGKCYPTDTTYTPAVMGTLTLLVGFIENKYVVVAVWFAVQVTLIFFILRSRTMKLLDSGKKILGVRSYWFLFVIFTPLILLLQYGQFTIFVLAGALLALDNEDRPLLAGFFLFLMMFKPTFAVPMVAFFLGRKYWMALLFALFLYFISSLFVSIMTNTSLNTLYRQWFEVGSYYGWNKHWSLAGWRPGYIKYIMLAVSFSLCWFSKRVYGKKGILFAGVFSLFWTYSQYYDLILCAPLLIAFSNGTAPGQKFGHKLLTNNTMKIISISLYMVTTVSAAISILINSNCMPPYWYLNESQRPVIIYTLAAISFCMVIIGSMSKLKTNDDKEYY